MERVTGFEPATSCLGSKRSTTELHPPFSCLIYPPQPDKKPQKQVPYFNFFPMEEPMPSCSALTENYTFLPDYQSIQSSCRYFTKSLESLPLLEPREREDTKQGFLELCLKRRDRADGCGSQTSGIELRHESIGGEDGSSDRGTARSVRALCAGSRLQRLSSNPHAGMCRAF